MRTLQCTIAGKDSGGYAWMNVFHVTTTDDALAEHLILDALNAAVIAAIIPVYQAAMAASCIMLDVSSRLAPPTAGFTLHNPISEGGTRDIPAYPGPVNGKIAWYPESGSHVGHTYVTGCCEGDFTNDVIDPAYLSLLEDLIGGFMSFDGTPATYGWQLVVYSVSTEVATPVSAGTALSTATYLSKRARA